MLFYQLSNKLRVPNPTRQFKIISMVWVSLLNNGGALIGSNELVWGFWNVGHLSFLQAIVLPSHVLQDSPYSHTSSTHFQGLVDEEFDCPGMERVFLIADPEMPWFKVLTFADLLESILNPGCGFTFDVSYDPRSLAT